MDDSFKTIAQYLQKLAISGLVNKKYQSQFVTHSLSPYGKKIVKIIKTF
jgi:hypothetical protein